jgi:hypothetical protein
VASGAVPVAAAVNCDCVPVPANAGVPVAACASGATNAACNVGVAAAPASAAGAEPCASGASAAALNCGCADCAAVSISVTVDVHEPSMRLAISAATTLAECRTRGVVCNRPRKFLPDPCFAGRFGSLDTASLGGSVKRRRDLSQKRKNRNFGLGRDCGKTMLTASTPPPALIFATVFWSQPDFTSRLNFKNRSSNSGKRRIWLTAGFL